MILRRSTQYSKEMEINKMIFYYVEDKNSVERKIE